MTAGADEFHVEIQGKGGHGIILSPCFQMYFFKDRPKFMISSWLPDVLHSDGGMLIPAS